MTDDTYLFRLVAERETLKVSLRTENKDQSPEQHRKEWNELKALDDRVKSYVEMMERGRKR